MRQLVLLLLCSLLAAQSQKQPTSNKQNTQEQVQKPTVNQSISKPSESRAVQGKVSADNHQHTYGEQRVKEINDTLLVIFTGLLFVVGALQWWVLHQHEQWMQKHDAKLEKLAQAANDNARALANSERAWVTVFVEWVKGATNLKTIGENSTQVFVNLICSNRGHSPAWIVERAIKAEISDGFYGPDISTVHDAEIDRQLIPLAPTGVNGSRDDVPRKLYVPDTIGTKFVLIYGVVKYRDVFTPKGQLRETWFGFYTTEDSKYDPPARIHQSDYNKYT